MKPKVYILMSMLLFLFASSIAAKGIFPKVIISGPGINEPIVILDEAVLAWLSMTGLMIIPEDPDQPAWVGTGYELFRGSEQGDEFVPFDHLIYYPDTSTGEAAVYYVGLVNGGSEYDGHWFQVTEEGDAAMRAILAENGIAVAAYMSAPVNPSEFAALVMELNGNFIHDFSAR